MKNLLVACTFFLFTGCAAGGQQGNPVEEGGSRQETEGRQSYPEFLQQVQKERHAPGNKKPEAAARYLHRIIDADVPRYWTGTPWDFNGTTRTPGVGSIACGYFVTNVLDGLGFRIQRVKLAQQASSRMIEALTVDVKRCSSIASLKEYLGQQQQNGVFIVGLDFHTGFIIKTGSQYYFLHANYINRQGVVKEKLDESAALAASKSFMIGSLTGNRSLLQQWIKS